MSKVTISCPHCHFSKDVASERIVQNEARVTCPICNKSFLFRRGKLAEGDIRQGGAGTKRLLVFFVLIIAFLVGVRLWAESKIRNVPFPNFIAMSARGVAVNWGQEIYFLDHRGKVIGKQRLPEDVILTQLNFAGDELWIGNHARKRIQRLRNSTLETIVDGSALIRGTFKFTVDTKVGEIFVTDASNHKVHVFSSDGRHIRSFGSEGKNAGELKFPNSIVFDQDGNLLIVNTNAHRLDLFSRTGEYLKAFAEVEAIENYSFPTLLAQVGNRVAFLLTADLRSSKVVMYGNDGRYRGEFATPEPLEESGDIASWGGKVLVTDNQQRKIYQFGASDLAYTGQFSAELDTLGAEATGEVARYVRLSKGALIALILCCIPVFFLYLRMRRSERRKIASTDYTAFIPPPVILSAEIDRKKLSVAILMFLLSWFCNVWMDSANLAHKPIFILHVIFALGVWFLRESGLGNPARRVRIEKLARTVSAKLSGILTAGESVEKCTVLRRNPYLKQLSLLLFTSRRILIFDFAAQRVNGCIQFGYADVSGISLEPAKISFGGRMLKGARFRHNFSLTPQAGGAVLRFSGQDLGIFKLLRQYVELNRTSSEALGYSQFCETCYRPLAPTGCPVCHRGKKDDDWKPLLLSLLYPGLGQFYNREIRKGAFFCVSFTVGVISLTKPIIQLLDQSAEVRQQDVFILASVLGVMLFHYVLSTLDADLVGRKGRQLFSGDLFRRKA